MTIGSFYYVPHSTHVSLLTLWQLSLLFGGLVSLLGALTLWCARYYLITKDSCSTILNLHDL
jgi:Na+/melibiose symporter-like transporter